MKKLPLLALAVLPCVSTVSVAQETSSQATTAGSQEVNPTTVGGKWYINFRGGRSGDEDFSRFGVDRGYIIIRHQLTDHLSGRITPDVSMDREGDGEGDLEVRLKYCYVDLSLDDVWILTEPHVQFGLVHRPWLDYEEHVNYYRVQGTMYLERNDIFNSGDYGFTAFSLIGGRMGEEYRERVNSRYPGRYGSLAIGLYNGGGYHAIERNTNKTVEGRLTLRPLPDVIPGLQFSYQGVYGTGNEVDRTDWTVNLLFTSWESERLIVTGQYYWGKGSFKGTAVDAQGDALRQSGFSLFGEVRLHDQRLSLLGRYDYFDNTPDRDAGESERILAGVAYRLKGHTQLVLDYDVESFDRFDSAESSLLKFSVEFSF